MELNRKKVIFSQIKPLKNENQITFPPLQNYNIEIIKAFENK